MSHSGTIVVDGVEWRHVDLRAVAGADLDRLPFSLRVLLENAIRGGRADEIRAILDWLDHRGGGPSITFAPRRILMHDTTAVPALVDLAAMQDVIAESGGAPLRLGCPVDIAIDHSVAVDSWGNPHAMLSNHRREMIRHGERYAFLKWAGQAFDGVTVHPPGRAILHTLNLECLARVVDGIATPDGPMLVPDTMIGTDSHTPMINALGVLGWGVGGLEAEAAMLCHPMPIRLPEVIGVRLTGRLRPGVLATDLALHVTARLRERGVVGAFVEFHGPGLRGLSVGTRAAVANMAPEYGATTGYFPIDAAVTAYLAETGRSADHVARVEAFARAAGFWAEPDLAPDYTDTVTIDLSSLDAIAAGPHRPHDRKPLSALAQPAVRGEAGVPPLTIPPHAVAIAAITSCTATADLEALVTAALLARRAAELGLSVPAWVKTSFAPGSAAMLNALQAGELMTALEGLGFHAAAVGCTTCIGNSGPLAPPMAKAIASAPERTRCAVLSGNRNFPGRIHADITEAWLVSPPMVIAFALAGRRIDVGTEPLGTAQSGAPVTLAQIWPAPDEIARAMTDCRSPAHTRAAYGPASITEAWEALESPLGMRYDWQPESTVLRTPPFVRQAPALCGPTTLRLRVLAAFGDDVTTDHISPAGAIAASSAAARHLAERGVGPGELGNYAARRGNFEVMARGAFTNGTLVNLLAPDLPAGQTRLSPGGESLSLYDAASKMAEAGDEGAIVAGARYGQGSSRDWGAKAPALLGVRAILARSFERIHRSNLIGMGLLPIVTDADLVPEALAPQPGDVVEIAVPADLAPQVALSLTYRRADGTTHATTGRLDCATMREVAILRAGGMIAEMLALAVPAPARPTMLEAHL